MAKYKNKPIVIEAFRIGIDDIPDWAMDKVSNNEITLLSPTSGRHSPFEHMNDTYCVIRTIKGVITGNHGDYIIQDVNDKVYPCTPDKFEKTYQKIEAVYDPDTHLYLGDVEV